MKILINVLLKIETAYFEIISASRIQEIFPPREFLDEVTSVKDAHSTSEMM
jgi:hypothetical protein